MAEIVLCKGDQYITTSETGAVLKTENVDNAKRFATRADAIELAWKCPNKCKGFQPVDLKSKRKRYATEVRRMIYLRNGGRCAICGKRLDLDNCNLDHRIPLSKGGRDNVENLDCVHIQCNYIKANLLPDELENEIKDIFLYQMEKNGGYKLRYWFVMAVLKKIC